MRITLVGHSTVLIEAAGVRILTDPFFRTFGNPAYARVDRPALDRQQIGELDAVLLSHTHWDHVDRPFLRSLAAEVPVLAPRWTTWLARLRGARRVVGVTAGESLEIGPVRLSVVPAVHLVPSVGYLIAVDGDTVYFAGDTFRRPFMAEIGRRSPTVALLPVTTFRIPMTMGERSAARALADLEPDVVIPIHRGIVPRSPLLRRADSVEGFTRRVRAAELRTRVVALDPGEWYELGSEVERKVS